jgi:hypothetical protein
VSSEVAFLLWLQTVLNVICVGIQKLILDGIMDYVTEMCKQLINYVGVMSPRVVMGYRFPRSTGVLVDLYVYFVNPASENIRLHASRDSSGNILNHIHPNQGKKNSDKEAELWPTNIMK